MATECPICHGTGFELKTRDDGILAAARCRCELEDKNDRRLRAARIPQRYDHCTFEEFVADDPTQARAIEEARSWVDQWPAVSYGLLFHGRPGRGKTHLAVATARALVKKGAQVRFYEHRELLRALQETYDAGSHLHESEVLGTVQDAEVLVLDDLGAGRITEWGRDVIHDIVAHRYNERKPLILTSSRTLEERPEAKRPAGQRNLDRHMSLAERLGEALMSRIHEMCRIIEMRSKTDFRISFRKADIDRY